MGEKLNLRLLDLLITTKRQKIWGYCLINIVNIDIAARKGGANLLLL